MAGFFIMSLFHDKRLVGDSSSKKLFGSNKRKIVQGCLRSISMIIFVNGMVTYSILRSSVVFIFFYLIHCYTGNSTSILIKPICVWLPPKKYANFSDNFRFLEILDRIFVPFIIRLRYQRL